MDKPILFRRFKSGEWFADVDGKRIARKSLFDVTVEDAHGNITIYKSHIEHCCSCISDALDGYANFDYTCCCVHSHFKSKREENDYLGKIGFWKIPFNNKQEE